MDDLTLIAGLAKTFDAAILKVDGPSESTVTAFLQKAKRWGKAGSGILYICPADGTVFLQKRSKSVLEPGTWGVTGGAVKGTDGFHDSTTVEATDYSEKYLMDSARREVREELGIEPLDGEVVGKTVFEDDGFKYTTFIVAVSPAEKAKLREECKPSQEVDDADWFGLDNLPKPLHFGVKFTMDNFNLADVLADDSAKSENVSEDVDAVEKVAREWDASQHPRGEAGKFVKATGADEEDLATHVALDWLKSAEQIAGRGESPMKLSEEVNLSGRITSYMEDNGGKLSRHGEKRWGDAAIERVKNLAVATAKQYIHAFPEKYPNIIRHFSRAVEKVDETPRLSDEELLRKFVESQPRDEDGKWTDGGGNKTSVTEHPVLSPERIEELKKDPTVFWHGTPSGNLRGGTLGLHVGTYMAAKEALESRIGFRADGKDWDGTQEYGKTLLAGAKTLKKMDEFPTGHNYGSPEDDYLPGTRKNCADVSIDATYSNGEKVPLTSKPALFPLRIKGEMTNSPDQPMSDTRANATMKAQMKKGAAKRGYYYRNDGEDAGSISAVVPPGGKHLEIIFKSEDVELVKWDEGNHPRGPGGLWVRENAAKSTESAENASAQAAIDGTLQSHERAYMEHTEAANANATAGRDAADIGDLAAADRYGSQAEQHTSEATRHGERVKELLGMSAEATVFKTDQELIAKVAAEWDESKHPRASDGEFSVAGSQSLAEDKAAPTDAATMWDILDDPDTVSDIKTVMEDAEPLKLCGDVVPGVFLLTDHEGTQKVVEWDGQDKYVSVSEPSDYLYSGGDKLVDDLAGDIQERFSKEFWESPGRLFHATDSENVVGIQTDGLNAADETRGMTNRSVGAAVFTTMNEDSARNGTYGDAVFEIDCKAMKADKQERYVEMEPAAAEYEARSALAHCLGVEDVEGSGDGADDPDTVVVHGDIPAKYLRLITEPSVAKTRRTVRDVLKAADEREASLSATSAENSDAALIETVAKEWDESEHPRAKDGEFAHAGETAAPLLDLSPQRKQKDVERDIDKLRADGKLTWTEAKDLKSKWWVESMRHGIGGYLKEQDEKKNPPSNVFAGKGTGPTAAESLKEMEVKLDASHPGWRTNMAKLPKDTKTELIERMGDNWQEKMALSKTPDISNFKNESDLKHVLLAWVVNKKVTEPQAEQMLKDFQELELKRRAEQAAEAAEVKSKHGENIDAGHKIALDMAIARGFKPSATVEEANAEMNRMGVNGVFKRGQVGLANVTNAALFIAKQAGDPLPPWVKVQNRSGSSTAAKLLVQHLRNSTDILSTTLIINSSRASQAGWKKQVDEGHWSQVNVVLHELGHLKNLIDDKVGYITNSRFSAGVYGEERKTALKVSKYATESKPEFIAETYAGIRSGKTYPDDVRELYKKYCGKDAPNAA